MIYDSSHGERPARCHDSGEDPGPCPIASTCGGCALMSIPYREQLRRKTARVRAALMRHRELLDVEVSPCLPSPEPWRYRNRAKLAVGRTRDGVVLGLYRRGTNQIADLAPCLVQRPAVQDGIEILRTWLAAHGLARGAAPDSAPATVIYVDLREAAGERCHLTLVIAQPRELAPLPFDDLRARWPALAGIAVNYGNAESSYPIGAITRIVLGDETFAAPLPDESGRVLAFAVPVTGFFQVSTSLLPEIHRRMRAHLGDDGPLVDLYCGVGVHGLAIERRRDRASAGVIGIEENVAACEAARLNAEALRVRGQYVAGRVEERLDELLREQAPRRFVLNPGRSGCKPQVLATLCEIPAARIAYLSCNPDTLARDLAAAVGGGLRPISVTPLDLMPQTDHVEALAMLARA